MGGDLSWPPYMDDLNDCCYEAQVDDLKASGIHLTWIKKGNAGERKARKLDRVLRNSKWLSCFPMVEADFLPPCSSDHCPMLTRTGTELYRRKTTFRFFKMWADHPEFENIVQVAWQTPVAGTLQFQIATKLKAIKAALKGLNRSHFLNIPAKLMEAKARLLNYQRQLDVSPCDETLRVQE